MIRQLTSFLAAGILSMGLSENVLPSARAGTLLTNAADVLLLSPAEALSKVPVAVTGVVTAAETNWNGQFFVQDASGGVFVGNRNNPQPVPGEVVSVTGISYPGSYAPTITRPTWVKLGTAPLPAAKPVSIEQLMSGSEDSQRVEISAIVRSAKMDGARVALELAAEGCRLRAYCHLRPDLPPASLVGAKVRLAGTVAVAFNAPLRHFVTVALFAPQTNDVTVLEPAPANPFGEPLIPLNGIAQFRKDRRPGSQVHIKGVVGFQRMGEDLFLLDATGGLQVKCTMTEPVAPGDQVEAVGFPAVENYLPVLEDAQFRKTASARIQLTPQPATIKDLQHGLHHADFITLRGRLIDRQMKGIDQRADMHTRRTLLILQNTNVLFTAEAGAGPQDGFLNAIPLGSLLEISGLCLLESSEDGTIKSFRLLLPPAPAIRILETPGWLTPQHLLVSLACVFAGLLTALGWSVLVSKNNLILKSLVREKEAAQSALQQAHDLLEDRVRERTNQLKIEMTARKESELQFRATLTERTRLAQELHDTLEQTMTGIALQMDLVANRFKEEPEAASRHLKLARNLMRQSQLDVRQSVWGLRSRASEQFNLTNAMLVNSRQIAGGAGIHIQVDAFGVVRPLSEVVEENLMRISQEALTNAVKHSGASRVITELHFHPQQVVLQIRDNGRGFDPDHCAGPQQGHFGLLGIAERSERLGGKVQITSSPGQGTLIQVEIPLLPDPGSDAARPAEIHHAERS